MHNYDLAHFDFVSILQDVYKTDNLAKLATATPIEVLTVETDQATEYHARFYDAFETKVRALYREFISSFVPDVIGTREFCFQRVPTFRIHFPGNVAVGQFHTDGDYNHSDGEINFWTPFTPAWDSNSVWVEDALGSAKYEAMTLQPGQVLVFDAVNWSHGNKNNETGHTRVSFDFRCVPLADYTASTLRTVDAGRGLWIGDYFDVL